MLSRLLYSYSCLCRLYKNAVKGENKIGLALQLQANKKVDHKIQQLWFVLFAESVQTAVQWIFAVLESAV